MTSFFRVLNRSECYALRSLTLLAFWRNTCSQLATHRLRCWRCVSELDRVRAGLVRSLHQNIPCVEPVCASLCEQSGARARRCLHWVPSAVTLVTSYWTWNLY